MDKLKTTQSVIDRKPPYASTVVISDFLSKIQKINPPTEPITVNTIKSWAIAEKQEPSLLSALKFLGVIDDSGIPTEKFPKLQTTGETFKKELQQIIKSAYADFFNTYKDVESLKKVEIVAFFQRSSNASKEKMATLFGYLCNLAGMPNEAFSTVSKEQKGDISTNGRTRLRPPRITKAKESTKPRPIGSEILQLAEIMKDWDAEKMKVFFEEMRRTYPKEE